MPAFATAPCPNCGSRSFQGMENSGHAAIIAANKEDQDETETRPLENADGLPLICTRCGYIKPLG